MREERLYTIRQIAEALRVGKRAAEMKATRECWPYEEEPHAGRPRRIYAYRALPRPVQQAIDDWEAAKYHRAKMAEIEAEQQQAIGHLILKATPARSPVVRWLARLLRPVLREALRQEVAQ
jgi:hypothetical protein